MVDSATRQLLLTLTTDALLFMFAAPSLHHSVARVKREYVICSKVGDVARTAAHSVFLLRVGQVGFMSMGKLRLCHDWLIAR
mmetsp:Transcript_8017/g.16257  ORF Transcript_8017/g.16257 Transcript_8017/m.16257 type:complete len:82 (-) Transcript_8017:2147-2392(-)